MAQEFLTRTEAAAAIGVDLTAIENYLRVGELVTIRHGRRLVIPVTSIEAWMKYREFSTFILTQDDYLKCLDFAVRSYYQYPGRADFAGARQRGIGKWAEDFVSGKLGEIAVERFFLERFGMRVTPDFTIREDVVIGQDIGAVARRRVGRWVENPPRIRVNIKATKMRNVYLFIPRKEFEAADRRSDVYILSRVDLPLNHVLRFLREHPSLGALREMIPPFEPFPAQVAGFAWREDLAGHFFPKGIPGTDVESPQYAMTTGELRRAPDEWQQVADSL
jgi:hypothetical protein